MHKNFSKTCLWWNTCTITNHSTQKPVDIYMHTNEVSFYFDFTIMFTPWHTNSHWLVRILSPWYRCIQQLVIHESVKSSRDLFNQVDIWKMCQWLEGTLWCYSRSTAPSPIDPVLTVQPDHCYILFSLKNTFKNYFINYNNIIHLSLVRRIRQTLKTKPLIMLLYNQNLLIDKSGKIH